MSKILEKLVFNRVISFLNKQHFFYKYQFGFRKNHFTLHAIFLLTENITDAFENKKQVLSIFLDLSKTFDTIDHKILLEKLWHYGIRRVANKCFDSYLSNRKQLVGVNSICSDTKIIDFGVPQGSILGPSLFSIHINDLNRSLTSGNCIMYADDTGVFLKNKCYEELCKIAKQELININNWFSENRLILNTDKTHYMIFRTAKTKPFSNNLSLSIKNNFVSQQSKQGFWE